MASDTLVKLKASLLLVLYLALCFLYAIGFLFQYPYCKFTDWLFDKKTIFCR